MVFELGFNRFPYVNALIEVTDKFREHINEAGFNESMKTDELLEYELARIPLISKLHSESHSVVLMAMLLDDQ
jgi:hypothetical protein